MKKLLLVLAFVTMSFVSNAQLFVAGSVSANYSGGSTEYTSPFHTKDDKPQKFNFAITPAVGYMIPGKSYGFGLSLGYAYGHEKDCDYYNDFNGDVIVTNSTKNFSNAFDIAPFFRYAYAKFDKITLYVDAKLPIGVVKNNTKSDNVTRELGKAFVIGARLIPGLTYKFNDHILFTTEIGLLSINYMHTKITTFSSNVVDKTNDFTIGANNRTIASFGFVYLF